jgi:hypothetical protein
MHTHISWCLNRGNLILSGHLQSWNRESWFHKDMTAPGSHRVTSLITCCTPQETQAVLGMALAPWVFGLWIQSPFSSLLEHTHLAREAWWRGASSQLPMGPAGHFQMVLRNPEVVGTVQGEEEDAIMVAFPILMENEYGCRRGVEKAHPLGQCDVLFSWRKCHLVPLVEPWW